MEKKMGRPAVNIDHAQLEALLRLKPRLEDVAAFFKCSSDTIERFIRREYDKTFAELREQNAVHTRFSLIRTAIQKAEGGDNTMLIFALKNLCGWKDRYDPDGDEKAPVVKADESNAAKLYKLARNPDQPA